MAKRVSTIVIVLVVLVGGLLFARKLFASSAEKDQNQYRLAEVKTDLVKKTVTATGVLKAWSTVDIKSKAGGRVDRLPVQEGTIVKKGDLIAAIDPSDTLLTYNQAKADIVSNNARVDETSKTMALQLQQTNINEATATASLNAARAAAAAARASYASAKSQAEAQGELTEANVENAKASLAAEKEKLAQMTSAMHPQQQTQAEAALRTAKANLKNAEAQLRRQEALQAKGFVAQSQVDTAQATYDSAAAEVQNAQRKIDTIAPELSTDLRSEQAQVRRLEAALRTAEANRVDVSLKKQAADSAYANYQQAIANVKQSEAKLEETRAERLNNTIRLAQVKQAEASGERAKAAMVNAQTQLDQTKVTAPNAGIILTKYVEQGTLITSGVSFNSTGTSIVQMGDISRMYVDVQVDETDVASVDLDQKVDITFDAYATTPFEGKVIRIDPQAVVESNVTTVHVRVEVDNSVPSFRLLKPGMNASCEFIVQKKDDVVAIPNEALKTDQDGSRYVEVSTGGKPAPADKDSDPDPNLFVGIKIDHRKVEVGLEGNDTTEITSGLKVGEKIVTQTVEPSTATPSSGGNPFNNSRGPGRR